MMMDEKGYVLMDDLVYREEDPLGDWSLLVYDVTHPETNGTMLNWTLTLWGEMDPEFEGEPIHDPLAEHNTTVSDAHSTIVPSPVPTSTTLTEHVPARPTRLKSTTTATPTSTTTLTSTTTSTSSTTEEEEEEEDTTTSTTATATTENDSTDTQTSTPESISPAADAAKQEDEEEEDASHPGSGSTVIYALVGTGAIVALATGLYVQKRKSWQPPVGSDTERRRQGASDYEFSVLRRSEEDEADDDDITSDRHALLPENDPSRRNRS